MESNAEAQSSASSDDQSSVHSVVHVETTTSTVDSEASRVAIQPERQKQIPVRGYYDQDEGNDVVLESLPRKRIVRQQAPREYNVSGDASTSESEADDEENVEKHSETSSSSENETQP